MLVDVYTPLGGMVLNLMQGQWFAFSITIVKQERNGKRRERKGRKREGERWEGRREGDWSPLGYWRDLLPFTQEMEEEGACLNSSPIYFMRLVFL